MAENSFWRGLFLVVDFFHWVISSIISAHKWGSLWDHLSELVICVSFTLTHSRLVLLHFNKRRKWTSLRLPFFRVRIVTNGSLISIIFFLLQKYLMPGRRYLLESMSPEFIMILCEIHCPLLPTPSRTGMKCALNWSEIHHMQQQWALALPLFLVWNRYTIFPPDLFRDLHCSFHAEQQLLWTVWVCHSSQMNLSFCLKLVLITKAWF